MKDRLDIVVGAYIIDEKDRVLLIHHRKLNKWLPVGGHIEPNETPDGAVKREAREEVGLKLKFVHYPKPRRGNMREYAHPFYQNVHHVKDHLHYCLFYVCKPRGNARVKINKREIKAYGWFDEAGLYEAKPQIDWDGIAICQDAIMLSHQDRLF